MENNKTNEDREKAYQDMLKSQNVESDQIYLNEVVMGNANPVKVEK